MGIYDATEKMNEMLVNLLPESDTAKFPSAIS